MANDIHPFDEAIALEPLEPGRWRARTSDDYWNMVGPFGGIVAALMLRAPMQHPEREGEPVALTVNFCAPVAKGQIFLDARPARTNRSTQHFTVEMRQDDQVVATGTALFASRPDTFAHHPLEMPQAPAFDTLQRYPPLGLGWTERYDMRFAEGPLEFGEEPGPTRSTLWVADDPVRSLDFAGLAAMCDIFFGRIIHVRRQRLPFGTVTMTAYFHATSADLERQGSTLVLGRSDARIFERGFHDQTTELWGADGRLLATAHQLVYFRDPR